MTSQLRIYRIRPGEMDAFVALWRDHILAARGACGFTATGAWVAPGTDEFVWVVSHEGPQDWETANQQYYDSPERAGLPRDPGEFIQGIQTRLMEPVSP